MLLRGRAAARSAGLCCLFVAGTAKEAATAAAPPCHPSAPQPPGRWARAAGATARAGTPLWHPAGRGGGAGDGSGGKAQVPRLRVFWFWGRGGESAVFQRKSGEKKRQNQWKSAGLLAGTSHRPEATPLAYGRGSARTPNGLKTSLPRRITDHADFNLLSRSNGVGCANTL